MKKFLDKMEEWVGLWVPGIIAWPLGLLGALLLLLILFLALPPTRWRELRDSFGSDEPPV